VVSERDRQHILSLTQNLSPTVIPNCLDIEEYQRSEDIEPIRTDLLFSGKMDYRPNVDAALWFATEIWPRIKRQYPAATWTIAGQKPHQRLNWLRSLDGVTVTGRVDSIKPYFAGAKVYVMPLRMGSGTRLKVLEAMASGIAIVSTSVGIEGYPLEPGKQLLKAEEPQAFADAVLHLLQNREERTRLAINGKMFAEQYDWRRIIPRFEQLYAEVLSN
jgi:glycosyltransferase involved in cell wall biosynthesis